MLGQLALFRSEVIKSGTKFLNLLTEPPLDWAILDHSRVKKRSGPTLLPHGTHLGLGAKILILT